MIIFIRVRTGIDGNFIPGTSLLFKRFFKLFDLRGQSHRFDADGIPALGLLGYPLESLVTLPPVKDRRMRLLYRFRVEQTRLQLVELIFIFTNGVTPETLDYFQVGTATCAAFFERRSTCFILLNRPPETNAKVEPSVGKPVDVCGLFGGIDGLRCGRMAT